MKWIPNFFSKFKVLLRVLLRVCVFAFVFEFVLTLYELCSYNFLLYKIEFYSHCLFD